MSDDDFDQIAAALAAQQVLTAALMHGLIAQAAKSSDDPARAVRDASEGMMAFINNLKMPGADDAPEWERAREQARRTIDQACAAYLRRPRQGQ